MNIIFSGADALKRLSELKKRGAEVGAGVTVTVREIIADVGKNGDAALKKYCEKFDGAAPERFELTKSEIEAAAKQTEIGEPELYAALKAASENIRDFHSRQLREGYRIERPGAITGQLVRPLEKVGLYVPGGTAAYPSTVLMNAVPAKVAGVKELVMVTPPMKNGGVNPVILTAAYIAGVDRVFAVGGAQAVAALAFGTESIPKVDKIVGPGNIYVATAKREVYGKVDIDMIAGPSEILIIADGNANPAFVAADMLSQAEHDMLASAVLLTTSASLANSVSQELENRLPLLPREGFARKAIENCGAILVIPDLDACFDTANAFAPEHLELLTDDAEKDLEKVKNAGSVFLGQWSPEPLGDYFAGPNHVLPTSGTARFFSPLSVDCYVKKMQYIGYSREALLEAKDSILTLARHEGLDAHAAAVAARFERQ